MVQRGLENSEITCDRHYCLMQSLLKDLQQHKIINLEDLSQKKLNEVVQFWNKEKPSCIPKQSANLKAFLNYCIKSQKFNSATYHSLIFPSTTTTAVVTDSDFSKLLEYVILNYT